LLLFGCDFVVQPNIHVPFDTEGFGLVIIEATLRGAPVIASDLEGIQDAVSDGVTGILVPPEDAYAWRSAVISLADNFNARAELGRRFRANAIDLFGCDRMGRDLVSAITSHNDK
jgi:glycosyltransferase involved in cell wall biosynthesis